MNHEGIACKWQPSPGRLHLYSTVCGVEALNQNGIDTDTSGLAIADFGCIACHKCNDRNRCVFEDTVNDFLSLAEDYDGFDLERRSTGQELPVQSLLSGPCFYADLNGGGRRFYLKPVAAIMSARRAGTTATWDQLNKYFGLMQMPIITSRYWNMMHGTTPQEVMQDREGLATLRTLGHNMAYYLKCKEVGSKLVPLPPEEPWEMTNFIR